MHLSLENTYKYKYIIYKYNINLEKKLYLGYIIFIPEKNRLQCKVGHAKTPT